MSLTLDLPPSVEERIRVEAAARGKGVREFLCEYVVQEFPDPPEPAAEQAEASVPADDPGVSPGDLTYEQWRVRFDRMLNRARENPPELPPGHVTDDSRESIY